MAELGQQRSWLEITDRIDIGTNLKAPSRDKNGNTFWSYDLVRAVQAGDVIYHYDTKEGAIVGSSIAVGQAWQDYVVWASKGTSSRNAGIEPHSQSGWYLGLTGYMPIEPAVARREIFDQWKTVAALRDAVAGGSNAAQRFPFYLYGEREVRAMQAYLAFFPAGLLEIFARLRRSAATAEAPRTAGQPYRPADEFGSVAVRDPFAVDPALVERGLRAHAATQNALAFLLREMGIEPLSPGPRDANFDLAWKLDGSFYVAEIKSVTRDNEEQQLRLGLGQVLRYRHFQSALSGSPAIAVLILEQEPSDSSWAALCLELGVFLDAPPFNALRGKFHRVAKVLD